MAEPPPEERLEADYDLTHCPICMEVFDNPRSLPCLHTFCFKCLDNFCAGLNSGGTVECPICRRQCDIPLNGIVGFMHNFFIQRIVDGSRVPSCKSLDVLCEPCSAFEENLIATKYCMDCRQNLCDRCSRTHTMLKGGPHKVQELGAQLERELVQLSTSYCNKHDGKQLELYCYDCKCNICLKCFAVNHRNHNCHEIEEVAHSFTAQMDDDLVAVTRRLDEVIRQGEEQKSAIEVFVDKMGAVVAAVHRRCSGIMSYVDSEKQQLLQKLQLTHEQAIKEFKEIEDRKNLLIVALKSFITYSMELREKGQQCDITQAGDGVHNRATEILTSHPVEEVYRGPNVVFQTADLYEVLTVAEDCNFIGQLLTTDGMLNSDDENFLASIKTAKQRHACKQKEIQKKDEAIDELKRHVSKLRSELTEQNVKSSAEIKTLKSQVSDQMRNYAEKDRVIDDLEQQVNDLHSELNAASAEISELRTRLSRLSNQNRRF